MYYAITHLTIYKYSQSITDSVMEVRKQPRNDDNQRCVRFDLEISPESRVLPHKDYLGNHIHTFDVPATHTRLAIRSEAVVDVRPKPDYSTRTLPMSAWDEIDQQKSLDRDLYDMLLPGAYTHSTDLLQEFANEINWSRRTDPLSLLRELNAMIYNMFQYEPDSTKVDSTIDVALAQRRGVCQDYSHIMITLARNIGIPTRYISGYLFHRSDRSSPDASHAWIEAWLPELGWVGFDPTNNLIVSDRHISVSIGSDYYTASPTRGVFKGKAYTELEVQVQVSQLDELPFDEVALAPEIIMPKYEYDRQQQQQQQQQQ